MGRNSKPSYATAPRKFANSFSRNAALKYEIILFTFSLAACTVFFLNHGEDPRGLNDPHLAVEHQVAKGIQVQMPANAESWRLISNESGKSSLASIAADSATNRSVAGDDLTEPGDTVGKDFAIDDQADHGEVEHIAPILRRDGITGQLVIGNYGTVSFAGEGQSCREIGASLLRDLELTEEGLDVLVDTNEITLVRICAKNGSVVMTCRNDLVTISRRGSRPDDKCNQSI